MEMGLGIVGISMGMNRCLSRRSKKRRMGKLWKEVANCWVEKKREGGANNQEIEKRRWRDCQGDKKTENMSWYYWKWRGFLLI